MPCCASWSGRTASRRRRVEHAGELAPAVGVGQERPVVAGRRLAQPAKVAALTRGMSTASTPSVGGGEREGVAPGRAVRRPGRRTAGLAGERHRARRRHRVADHDHLVARRPAPRARARAGCGRRARPTPCRRRPGARALPPGEQDGSEGHVWQSRTVCHRLRIALVQAGLRSRAGRQPRLARPAHAPRRGPRGLPGGLRPRLRRGRLRRQCVRRAARRAVRDRGRPGCRRARRHGGGRDVRASDDPARPFNTLRGARRAPRRRTARSTSTTPSATASPTGSAPGRLEPVVLDVGGFGVGLMTCYDLRFPELARALVDAGAEVLVVPAAWVAGPAQGRPLAHAGPGPRDREHRLRRRRRPARPALHRPLAGRRPARRRARRGRTTAPRSSRAALDARGARAGPQDQPVAGQPASVTFLPVSRSAPRRRAERPRRRGGPRRSPRRPSASQARRAVRRHPSRRSLRGAQT